MPSSTARGLPAFQVFLHYSGMAVISSPPVPAHHTPFLLRPLSLSAVVRLPMTQMCAAPAPTFFVYFFCFEQCFDPSFDDDIHTWWTRQLEGGGRKREEVLICHYSRCHNECPAICDVRWSYFIDRFVDQCFIKALPYSHGSL